MTKKFDEGWTFKDLIMEMYREFPDARYEQNIVHSIIKTDKDRKMLEYQGYLIKEDGQSKGKHILWYGLGANAITLVNTWKTEQLTREIKKFTKSLLLLTGALVVLALLQLYVVLIVSL